MFSNWLNYLIYASPSSIASCFLMYRSFDCALAAPTAFKLPAPAPTVVH
jgi:hypothetical protein